MATLSIQHYFKKVNLKIKIFGKTLMKNITLKTFSHPKISKIISHNRRKYGK